MSHSESVDAVIVGAGLAGLFQLYRLRELGMKVRVIEAADDVGGTWYWNRYPGARCDAQSVAYSYSFSRSLEQEWTWSEKYATQPEILSYIKHVADRFDLRKDITFGFKVTSAAWNDAAGSWLVTANRGEVIESRWLIMATGCLSASKIPEVAGIDKYQGPTYHTGRWPHVAVDFSHKRVGVVGTGSSGIQSIPLIAEQASELWVFQRTPAFSLPARNRPMTDEEVRAVKSKYPRLRAEGRKTSFGNWNGVTPTKSALEVSSEERHARYEAGWEGGTLNGLLASYTDLLTDREANETAAEFVRAKIRDIVKDPETAETLSPRSFPFGTKRPCMDTGYYETFNSGHVHVVYLIKTPLIEFTETGVRTSEQEYELDAVVFATGFDAMTGALMAIDIRGRDGLALREKWGSGPRNYLGLSVAGFPNLFTITGPLSPSVLSNMAVSIEQHVDWISDCIAQMARDGVRAIEATVEAEDAWVAHVAELGAATLFPLAGSWYMGANVPGKPRVFMPYVAGVGVYRARCDQVSAGAYEGFIKTPS